jgi:large subunit ribosomal protein L24
MKASYSKHWKASTQPRKQRKYRHNAPLHVKGTLLGCHLAKELRTKHGVRSVRVRTGDKVRVMRGTFKGREGKVERIDLKKGKVYVTKVEMVKKDAATKVLYPLSPSSLMIVEMDMADKRRADKLKARGGKSGQGGKGPQAAKTDKKEVRA